MILDASGRLALGRISADHRLDVQGNILVRNTLGNASFYLAQESDNSSTFYQYNNGTLRTVISSNGNSYFNGGNVGIGVTPTQSSVGINKILDIGGASVPGIVLHSTNNSSEMAIGTGGDGLIISASGSSNAANDNVIRFFTAASNSSFAISEKMRLFSDGNLLITTGSITNAGFKLDVNGTGRFAGVGFGSNGLQTAGANGGNGIYAVAGGSGGSGVYGFTNDLSSFGGTFEHTGAGQGIALRVIGWSTFSQAATFSSSVTATKLLVGSGISDNGATIQTSGDIRADYASSIYLQINGGAAGDYRKGFSGINQQTGVARGLHIFNYDPDSSQGIKFYGGTFASRLRFGGFDSVGNFFVNAADTAEGYKFYVNGTVGITGAATFSSSVTATSFIVNTSGQARTISTFHPSGSAGENIWIGGGGTNSTTGGGASGLGSNNTSLGVFALEDNTTGARNTAIGYLALSENTSGSSNTASGEFSMYKNTTGYINSAYGSTSLAENTTGYGNAAFGISSLRYITTGDRNTAIGLGSGEYVNSGAENNTSRFSTYLGYDTRASANGNTNEVVIGSEARGQGSNSVVIGNGSITKTILRGDVLIGTETPATGAMLNVNGSIRTAAPTGTSTENWRLGRALLATSSDPEDRWIRVQLGTKIYDILAIDRGDA
jgi:hypothetical protein